jgi:D-amino-acid oxidase
VVNCTGLGALTLGGVLDGKVFPARGQIVLVRNDPKGMFVTSGTDDGADEATYIMHRASGKLCTKLLFVVSGAWHSSTPILLDLSFSHYKWTKSLANGYYTGGGTILGGCLQHNNWESQPCPNLAVRIMKRSVAVCPALADGKGIDGLSIIRHGVGLRPMREGGPRVEKELIDGVYTVHCYGHGGYGYQSSYGSAYMVNHLVNEAVKGMEVKARL